MKSLWPVLAVIVGIVVLGAVVGRLSCALPDVKLLRPDVAESQSNPELVVAVETARRSLNSFIERFQHPEAGDLGFGVQSTFKTPKGDEHSWIHLDGYSKGAFTGRLADEPIAIAGKHKGDTVTVQKASVTDWIYQSNGKTVGGFTIRALEASANAAGSR